jgi:protein SCO1
MTSARRNFLALMGGGAAVVAAATARAMTASSPGAVRNTGKRSDQFPDVPLRTHDDVPVRFYAGLVRDRVVIVNFMYTECGERCPLVSANLLEVYRRFGPRMGRGIHMLSISLTPEHDTPEMLRAYAAQFGGTPPGWLYLTGDRADIEKLRRAMGIYERDPALDADNSIHAGVLTFGNDRTDQWRALPALLEPRDLVAAIARIA